ncbi:Signal transduction histidine kinase [Pilibacter termitis]|uniref:histidine kinase n=1 Tax=Pilibacter termitis TaxID=263852 RepID=A0A1T4M6M0_9ENTE|nr:HAMP domain-containing sensor histidine kinase [Pilibacter termitis]SJZ62506.1 Signal transduction histidine kinase [Pilibacter termitis]
MVTKWKTLFKGVSVRKFFWNYKGLMILSVLFTLLGLLYGIGESYSFTKNNSHDGFDSFISYEIRRELFAANQKALLETPLKAEQITNEEARNYADEQPDLSLRVTGIEEEAKKDLKGVSTDKEKADIKNSLKEDINKEVEFNFLPEQARLDRYKEKIATAINNEIQDMYGKDRYMLLNSQQNWDQYGNPRSLTDYLYVAEAQGLKSVQSVKNAKKLLEDVSSKEKVEGTANISEFRIFESPALNTVLSNHYNYHYTLSIAYKNKEKQQVYTVQTKIMEKLKKYQMLLGVLSFGVILLILWQILKQKSIGESVKKIFELIPLEIRIVILLFCLFFYTLIMKYLVSFITSYEYLYDSSGFRMVEQLISVCLLFFFVFTSILIVKHLWLSIFRSGTATSIRTQFQNGIIIKLIHWVGKKVNRLSAKVYFYFLLLSAAFLGSVYIIGAFIAVSASSYPNALPFFISWSSFMALVFFGIYQFPVKRFVSGLFKMKKVLSENDLQFADGETLSANDENMKQIATFVAENNRKRSDSEQFKAELLTNISHDLRTPLTSIITYGDLLTHAELSGEEQQQFLSVINQKASYMKVMLDDLFDVTKMDNGQVELNCHTVNIVELVRQILGERTENFENKSLTLVTKFPELPIEANVDAEKIWRMFENLLTNAEKYSAAHTRIYVKLSVQQDEFIFEIKNTSFYELNEDADNLVQRFKRGDASRQSEGSGLGLAIVDSIVKLHSGELNVIVDGDLFKVIVSIPMEQKKIEE